MLLQPAVTEYRLNTDMSGAGSLAGALANPTNEDNKKLFERLFGVMIDKLKYCKTCARKTHVSVIHHGEWLRPLILYHQW